LLERVTKHYADAKSYHIESVEERTTTGSYRRGWEKTVLTAAEIPGNRYHYEGHSGMGGALQVSNGKTVWTYHIEEQRYTEKPVSPSESDEPKVITYAEMALHQAQTLRRTLANFAKQYKSADLLADDVLDSAGKKVACYVVRLRSADMKRVRPEYVSEKILWIDQTHETILKTVEHAHTYLLAGSARIPLDEERTTEYSVVELDGPVPESFFTFTPPSEAKGIAEFPDPFKHGGGADLTGETGIALKFKSADGKLVSLDSFRGKPVLLDLWATWCAPCVKAFPELAQLYEEAKEKGLIFISVDQDEESQTATDFLKKKGYSWPNFHDGDGEVAKALRSSGIPRTLLIDSRGTVVYDRASTGDELRAAIANLGPDYASLAPKSKPNPCAASN
jgi:thiol-disulfide isomerase/thioredoxin